MNWLARLKKIESAPAATLQNLQKAAAVAFVGFVGAYPDPFQNSESENSALVNEYSGPTNDANMSVDTFTARRALFTDRGLAMDEAQAMAERLELRDSQMDERRLCLECLHLSGTVTARRCSKWRMLGYSDSVMCLDLVPLLQRCAAFNERLKVAT